jgi:putative peptide zinc metalloprotease protein
VRFLAEAKLRPLGLLRQPDGSEPAVEKANPLLALRLKFVVSNPEVTRRITAPFAAMFHPPVVFAVLLGFALTTWWVALEKGLASATHQAFYEPGLLLLVFALTLLSAGFHEFGHAAACRYGGATPGAMGVGLYLVWPAFYTEVTDSYRLGRRGRLRVDLGGLYFNAVFAVAMLGVWAAVRWDALLLVIGAQVLQMLRQLAPLVRFDGYHILADLTGVPDLFAHIKPTLLGMLPSRWGSPQSKALKPWARVVVTVWVLVVVPTLAALLVLIVKVLPRLAATAWDSLGLQWEAFTHNWAAGDVYGIGVRLLSVLALCIPVLSMAYLLARVARRTARRVWRATAEHPGRRAATVLAGALVLAAVAWTWWPDGQYRPIEPDEGGTVLDGLAAAEAYRDRLFARPARPFQHYGQLRGSRQVGRSLGPAAGPRSPAARPQLMLVLVPQSGGASAPRLPGMGAPIGPETFPWRPAGASPDRPHGAGATPPVAGEKPAVRTGWLFPFPPPPEAREGDNRALAVNTEDGSVVYDVAFALVWVTDGSPVDQRNEAYALASCRDCRTLAVAFQVVLIVGQVDIVTPANAAVAANYDCVSCVTHALAVQLVATLTDLPDDEAMDELARIWAQLEAVGDDAALLPLEQVYAQLLAVEREILELLARDGGPVTTDTDVAEGAEPTPTPTPQPTATPEPDAEPTPQPTTTPTREPTAEATEEPTSPPTEEPTSQPTEEPTSRPTEEPTSQPSEEPTAEPGDEP